MTSEATRSERINREAEEQVAAITALLDARAPLIKVAFELYATGDHTLAGVINVTASLLPSGRKSMAIAAAR